MLFIYKLYIMKIGICGKMCSGKSSLAKAINAYYKKQNKQELIVDSFANKIYEIAYDIFKMDKKDRKLLQDIGTKFREIDDMVWVNYIINKHTNDVIIDDARYKNELEALKQNEYILIKLNISKELQLKRLKDLYKDNFELHYKNLNHISELFIDVVPDDIFDFIVNVDTEEAFDKIKDIL